MTRIADVGRTERRAKQTCAGRNKVFVLVGGSNGRRTGFALIPRIWGPSVVAHVSILGGILARDSAVDGRE
jgi:hypothetical protein